MDVSYERMQDDYTNVDESDSTHLNLDNFIGNSVYAPGETTATGVTNMHLDLKYDRIEDMISDIYTYYRAGGFKHTLVGILCRALLPLATCLILCLVVFYVNWNVVTYSQSTTKHAWFTRRHESADKATIALAMTSLFVGILSQSFNVLKAWRLRRCFRDHLAISDADTNLVSWTWMCRRIAARQPTMFGYNGTDWRHIGAYLCRRQNYIFEMFHSRSLQTCISSWASGYRQTPQFSTTTIYAKCVEWILGPLWEDRQFGASDSIVASITTRSRLCALTIVLCLPIALVTFVCYIVVTCLFGLRLSSGDDVSGPLARTWTHQAVLELSCFDESKCQFEERLARVDKKIARLSTLCSTGRSNHILSFLITILKAILVLMLLLGLIDGNITNASLWTTSPLVTWSPNPIVVTGYLISALVAISAWRLKSGEHCSERDAKISSVVGAIMASVVLPPNSRMCGRAGFSNHVDWKAISELDKRRTLHPSVYASICSITRELQTSKMSDATREILGLLSCIAVFAFPSADCIGSTIDTLRSKSTPISHGLDSRLFSSASFNFGTTNDVRTTTADQLNPKLDESKYRFEAMSVMGSGGIDGDDSPV